MFIIYCIIGTVLFGYGVIAQYRENNARRDIQRDLESEFYANNHIKRHK